MPGQVKQTSFHLSHYPKAIEKKIKSHKATRIALSVLTLGVYALSDLIWKKIKVKLLNHFFLPATFIKEAVFQPYREAFLKKHGDECKSVQIKSSKDVVLDAMQIKPEGVESKKWMIYFCPNAATYEELLDTTYRLAKNFGTNLLVFNYRGVGLSKSKPTSAFQLTQDGAAVVEYLKSKQNVSNENLLLYGHSIGGGVSTTLMEYYPEARIVNDRSFSSTNAVVRAVCGPLLGRLPKWMGYQIDAWKHWKKIPREQKLTIYHHADAIIRYRGASLYYREKLELKKQHPQWCEPKRLKHIPRRGEVGLQERYKPARIKLDLAPPHPHTAHGFPVRFDENAHNELVRRVKMMLAATPQN